MLNEALDDPYWAHHIPTVSLDDGDEHLAGIIADLLRGPSPPPAPPTRPAGDGPP